MKLKIKVDRHHILVGIQKSSLMCPVAAAIRQRGFPIATVTDQDIRARDHEGVEFRGDTPDEVRRFVTAFNAFGGERLEPFEFDCKVEEVRT